MGLKVEVTTKEVIKPSTPTPVHLKTLKLSLLDQYIPAIPVPIICFYSPENGNQQNGKVLRRLKTSLSEVLTDFYPLAGRVSGNDFIDCNDEGINFVQTQVVGALSDVVSHPEAHLLSQLLPVDNFYGPGPTVLLSVRVNHFHCGGLAIGVRISHKLGDAASLSLFVSHWAALARGDRRDVRPNIGTASIFPPHDESPEIPLVTLPTQTLASRRFVFSAGNIAALRAKCSDNLHVSAPTRVEAVSALIWRCAMNVSRMRTKNAPTQSVASFSVNVRGRMRPPLSNFWYGNLVLQTLARTNTNSYPELHCLVDQLREAIKKVDGNYATQLSTDNGFWTYLGHFMEVHELYGRSELELYNLSSWCRFPFYEADYGWGRPIWTTFADFSSKNLIGLMDTKCGQGIEAWVTLDEEDMARFEREPDLIEFTSTNSTLN